MKDVKYLLAYLAPFLVYVGIDWGGLWSFGSMYLAFLIIPIVELFYTGNQENYDKEEELSQSKRRFFDFLLYINLPIQFGLLFFFFYTLATRDLYTYEIIGMTINVGIMNGYCVNVAHELGHRHNTFDRVISELLLLPSLYMHFIIQHNFSHHKHVSTDKDPTSATLGQNVYGFYFQSVIQNYFIAWRIEKKHLERAGRSFFSVYNKMIWFHLIQTAYLVGIGWFFGLLAMGCAIVAGITGFLLLESINYVEHYGLRRKKLPNGRYEPVKPHHSWNSNHDLGRIFLYEVTRHSDHHYKADRKYQILRHFDDSPQLPYGYPSSILLALIPPLWFQIMNKEVAKFNELLVAENAG